MLLLYPSFSEEFIIHIDSSKTHIGGVMSQNEKYIAFYSRKLIPSQINYTDTERELLSISKTLK